MDMTFDVVYAPARVDQDGELWTQCLGGMTFYDSETGWAVGSGLILRTLDGGKSWVNVFPRNFGGWQLHPTEAAVSGATTCWIIGAPGLDVRCVCTRDAGKSWAELDLEGGVDPTALFFVDPNHGWIIGRREAESRVYATKDGGLSWEGHSLGLLGKPEKVRFADPQRGWLLETLRSTASSPYEVSTGLDGFEDRYPLAWPVATRLHTSVDGGQSWRFLMSFPGRVMDLHSLTANSLLVFGEYGYMARSEDGGATWYQSEPPTERTINAIDFIQPTLGIACGDHSLLMISEDFGGHWEVIRSAPRFGGGYFVRFFDSRRGVIGSSSGIYLFQLKP